jgi:dCMP deaminase
MRESWDSYFMKIAKLAATRSTCLRRQVGAVLVNQDRHIIATGYNGPPSGIAHCEDRGGCMRILHKIESGTRHEFCLAVHAEQNVLIQAALSGANPKGCTLYCTHQPCIICAKLLIQAGIKRIIMSEGYPDMLSVNLLSEAGIIIEQEGAGEE